MTHGAVAAVVVAAGRSERMGRQKLGLPLGSSTMLGWTVRTTLASGCDVVVVVAGPTTPSLPDLDRLLVTTNPEPERGNVSSLRCGIAAAPAGASIIVIPGDQPEISTDTIDRVIAASGAGNPWAVICEYQDGPGHPLLLSPAAVATVGDLEGTKPLWRHVVEDPPSPAARVSVASPRPIDVNAPDDYRTVLRRLGLDAGIDRSVP